MKKNAKIIIIAIVLVVILAVGAFFTWKTFVPTANAGTKTITLLLTHLDGSSKENTYETDAETLWALMEEYELAESTDSEYGIWITSVDGETADETQGQYWVFTKNGEWVDTSADATFIADGEHYEFYIYVA